jgi:2-dehydropantoate 2-reductase
VGLVIGARLAHAGCDVLFAVRRHEVAKAIEQGGVRCDDLAMGDGFSARARATTDLATASDFIEDGPVLFCMRRSQTEQAAKDLAALAPSVTAVSLQNDVDNEGRLAQYFRAVIGGVVRQTSTRVAPNAAVMAGAGRLVLGDHPTGCGSTAAALAGCLRSAGYDVGLSEHIDRDLWLKLCINLMSAPNALIRREDHDTPEFVAVKVRLLEEARDALGAAGIDARPCEGPDRSLEEEIAHQRGALERGDSTRKLPIYNQVWAALEHGLPLESNGYHRRIIELASRSGLRCPTNERVLAILEEAARSRRGPERARAAELLPDA